MGKMCRVFGQNYGAALLFGLEQWPELTGLLGVRPVIAGFLGPRPPRIGIDKCISKFQHMGTEVNGHLIMQVVCEFVEMTTEDVPGSCDFHQVVNDWSEFFG